MNMNERLRKKMAEKGPEAAKRRYERMLEEELRLGKTIEDSIKETREIIRKAESADKYLKVLKRIANVRKDIINSSDGDNPWVFLYEILDLADGCLNGDDSE